MIKETTEEFKKLHEAIISDEIELAKLKEQLHFESLKAENNIYNGDKNKALNMVEDYLTGTAESDCEGSYNCGNPEYKQEVIINGTKYLCTLSVEYNRHDKTYYYIEETDFKAVEI